MDYSDPHQGRYSRRLAFLRLGRGPRLHLLHIRHVNPHLGTQVQIFPRDGQAVFLGDALGLLGGDVSLDATIFVELHARVFADAVLLAVVGNEEAVRRILELE